VLIWLVYHVKSADQIKVQSSPVDSTFTLRSPLGFKSHILWHVRHEDFSGDGSSARCGYFYRMLELSGENRIAVVQPQFSKRHTAKASRTDH
jgi:hypothetical protein